MAGEKYLLETKRVRHQSLPLTSLVTWGKFLNFSESKVTQI